jgi:hypothetical protein
MAYRVVMFDAQELVKLLSHYTEGQVPLDTKLQDVSINAYLDRVVGLTCRSDQWQDGTPIPGGGLSPLQIRYEGKKIMTLGSKGQESVWYEAPEAPKR